jgi:hypothetical protein
MVEIPDEYGLSSDSLRGSVMHIRPDLVGADPNQRRDPYTGQGLTREPLSMNERVALRTIGTYVDQDGNREEPPPIERRPVDYAYPQTATIPAATGGISPGVLFPPSVDEQLTAEEWEQREANEPHRDDACGMVGGKAACSWRCRADERRRVPPAIAGGNPSDSTPRRGVHPASNPGAKTNQYAAAVRHPTRARSARYSPHTCACYPTHGCLR